MKRKPLTNKAGDVRSLTKEDFKLMRPIREVDPQMLILLKKASQELKRRGRPEGRTKDVVSLSLDKDVIASLRASGSGWQSRVNQLLRAAVGLQST